MKKIITLCLLLFAASVFALPSDKAAGVFLSFGVGPRMPLGTFADRCDLGFGFSAELSYTNNEYLPIFLFARGGFEYYPGSSDFYLSTDYANYTIYSFPFSAGARYYFPPMLENVVLFMPVIEVAASYDYYSILHEFKAESGRSNYTEQTSKFGFSAGAGISMFMMEILFTYNYFESNQFIGADLKIRLPLYISI